MASAELVALVKEVQKSKPDARAQWRAYCVEYGEGTRDPAQHDDEFITAFFDQYNSGVRMEVDEGKQEGRDGDWLCPECGVNNFASREVCFKCTPGEGKGKSKGKEGKAREGDWECPECGVNNFAYRDSCFKCVGGGTGNSKGKGKGKGTSERREGDWDCPECGVMNFASKEVCFKCSGAGLAKRGAPKSAPKAAPKAPPQAAEVTTPSKAILALAKLSPKFRVSWTSYCKRYGHGFSDPSKYDDAFISAFLEFAAGFLETGMQEAAVGEPHKRPAAGNAEDARLAKVAKGTEDAALPATQKKATMKKVIHDEILRMNASGGLLAPVRPGSVAALLSQISVETAKEILALLEEQQHEVPDPNVFIREQANTHILAA